MPGSTGLGNSADYTNHKMTGGNQGTEVYDTEGNMVTTTVGTTQTAGPNKYDVAGRVISENPDGLQTHYFDGDGNVVKISYVNAPSQYMVISRVVGGQPLTILNNSGTKLETSVFGNGQILARQVTSLLNQATGTAAPGVEFFHRDPHGIIDFSKQIKWIDPMGVTGFTQTAAGIAAYQGSYNPATGNTSYNGYTGLGNATNSNPSQMVTCKDGYVTVDCNSFFNGIRNGQYSHIWFKTPGLLGFDEYTTQLATSFGASATSRNGQPTGNSSVSRVKRVIPGDPNTLHIYGEDGDLLSVSGRGKDSIAYEYVNVVSGSGFEAAQQTGSTTSSQTLSSAISSFGPGCTIWFGGADVVKKLAADAEKKIKVISVGGPGYTDTIRNGKETHKSWWERQGGTNVGASAVGYIKSGSAENRPGKYMTVILGPIFYSNNYKNTWLSSYDKSGNRYPATAAGFAAFQSDALRHEWSHIYTNLGDRDLALHWQLAAQGYDYNVNDEAGASLAIQLFIKNDCRSMSSK